VSGCTCTGPQAHETCDACRDEEPTAPQRPLRIAVSAERDLEIARFELDVLDDQIVDLLLGRFRRLERVAEVKARGALPPHDAARERAIAARLEKRTAHASPEVRGAIAEIMSSVVTHGRLEVKRLIRRHDPGDGTPESMDAARRRGPGRGGEVR
jgi:chorismate mutase